MLNPSIDSLMKKLDSKYTLVTVSARRARELQQDGTVMLSKTVSHKNVGKALEEIDAELLKVIHVSSTERSEGILNSK
ncbi:MULTISPECIES: DNA-directed RNA polymerase subunit omega [Sutcliffiella]|uniref:DNA-directed RNA polymerase subunit omega n=1 Tax=Sutcliffiella cohnii TaxID=33932 RepID=A0A223KRV2_9BACI|nr:MULTISPECIES: DNA-directed RNA polymerase subunit omega [Sutcliffiella]AST92107.1 DNA-directed RNA polymerase subunit omega [Sutcliffiella cohnii]MED4015393.1 DNA-directed RNA polymerase subunit omega [Sutcliffiella cohnii]WBL13338.1 DNA-directed RNA polymerase subunit omega [Sutcliffiella sp. NC1]